MKITKIFAKIYLVCVGFVDMGKYDKKCALCDADVMTKGDIKKDFTTMSFGNKKIICCNDCKGKAKTVFNQ